MEKMPELSTLSKLWYSETREGEKIQISYVEEIPELEEAPESITGTALDIDYEFARPGKRKAGTIEVPAFYTHTQHKRLKAIEKKELYFFVELPEATAEEEGKPLVRMFQGSLIVGLNALSGDEFIKNKITIYKTSAVEEMEGMPTTNE